MQLNEALALAPAIGASTAHARVSKRYEFIPTRPIVEALLDVGWEIKSAQQNGRGDQFATHRVEFWLPEDDLGRRHPGEMRATALLINSHDRTRRLSLSSGVEVCACDNQLHVPLIEESLNRVHLGDGGFDLRGAIDNVIQCSASLPARVGAMRTTQLDIDQRVEFARIALADYRGLLDSSWVPVADALGVLQPTRREYVDKSDVWTTFNIVQERLITHGRRGGVHEVLRNRKLNLAMWKEAEALCTK